VLLCDYYSIQLKKPIRYEKKCYSDERSEVTVTVWGIHVLSPEEEKERLQWEGFAEKKKVLSLE